MEKQSRVGMLAHKEWEATGWDDFEAKYPIWHEAYLCGYNQAISHAAELLEPLIVLKHGKTIGEHLARLIRQLPDVEST